MSKKKTPARQKAKDQAIGRAAVAPPKAVKSKAKGPKASTVTEIRKAKGIGAGLAATIADLAGDLRECKDLDQQYGTWGRNCLAGMQGELTYTRPEAGKAKRSKFTLQAPLKNTQVRIVERGLTAKYVPALLMGNGTTDIIRTKGEFVLGAAVVSETFLVVSDIQTIARAADALYHFEVEWLLEQGGPLKAFAEDQKNCVASLALP